MPASLDPRDARPLTSREISKVLCGLIGGVVNHDPHAAAHVAPALSRLRGESNVTRWDLVSGMDATWTTALYATVSGLRGWCSPRDVETAIAWVAENLHLVVSPGSASAPN